MDTNTSGYHVEVVLEEAYVLLESIVSSICLYSSYHMAAPSRWQILVLKGGLDVKGQTCHGVYFQKKPFEYFIVFGVAEVSAHVSAA